jgi:hypothetical protein
MTEGTIIGPASDNQVVGLLEPGKVFGGVLPGQQSLHGGAADETRDDPASGIAIQHGNLFSHANGVANRDHVAQNGNFDSFGFAATLPKDLPKYQAIKAIFLTMLDIHYYPSFLFWSRILGYPCSIRKASARLKI